MNLTKPNQNITFKVGATNFELQRAIEAALPAAVAQTKDLAKRFQGSTEKESCQKIFSYLMSDITYKVDGDNQKIKLPSAFMREKSGDCKSYSLFTGAILSNLKIPFNFTYCSYNPKDKTPEHIYITTKKGCIIDAVYGKFNAEKKPCYKYQKPMNISYISGIKNHSINYKNKVNDYHNIGNIFSQSNPTISGSKGLGRTGTDWGNAVGRSFSIGEKLEYYSKSIAMAPARGVIEMFIRNNGGGIADFLASLSFRNELTELPNKRKFDQEYFAGSKLIDQKYTYKVWSTPADAVKRYQDAYAAFMAKNTNGTFTQKIADFYTTEQKFQYDLSKKSSAEIKSLRDPLDKALKDSLYKKYPFSTHYLPMATTASKEKWRGIEWKWFWSLGGNPDDLNEAVKEGFNKTPRGKDANYMLNKAYNGGLSAGDLPLVIRGLVSAQAGDKFQLGDEGTYVVAINGQKRIGVVAVDDAALIATITAYSAAILPIVAFMMKEIRATIAENKDPSANPNPDPSKTPPAADGGGGVTSILSGNTGIILLAAAGVGAYLYLK